MDTTVESVNIDSVDVINILFRLEDEYKVSIDLDIQAQPETVGDLVNALLEFIPHADDPK
jgi:acyl carrier protein